MPDQLFGIRYPIIQAPMAGAQGSALAAAVCNAGGLGSLPCAVLSAEAMRKELMTLRALTNMPFNVNFFSHAPPLPNAERAAAWQRRWSSFFNAFDVDQIAIGTAPALAPIGHDEVEVLAEFRPAVVSFHFGLPSPEILGRIHAFGARILATATTVEEARWLEAQGVDAIIAQGLEAGGHRGMFLSADMNTQLGTFALLPQVVQAVTVPVIAAGGIADARGVASALVLGAAGVQIGTAFLACQESTINPVYRKTVLSDAARHTTVTNIFTGRPARAISNRFVRELEPLCPDVPDFPLALPAVAAIRAKVPAAMAGDFAAMWCGQNASGCKDVPAAALLQELVSGI